MNLNSIPPRDYSLDNVRCILIFSVVFSHLLEVCTPFKGSWLIYKCIYAFHMPAFVFLFGYNVRYSPKKIVFRWCFSYVFFQCAYLLFSKYVLKAEPDFQFATPYWLLWYCLVCIYYQLLLPLFDTDNPVRQLLAVTVAFILSLLIGFEKHVGYYMSLSRFFVFQPWFLLGYYCKKNNLLERLSLKPGRRLFILFGSAAVLSVLPFFAGEIPDGLLYGSYPYASCEGTLWMRAVTAVTALSVILFLCVGIRPYLNRNLLLLTRIGQNTWPVFLLHGFAVKAVPVYFPYLAASPWHVILLTCGLVILTGNQLCSKAVYYACFSWLEKHPAKPDSRETV